MKLKSVFSYLEIAIKWQILGQISTTWLKIAGQIKFRGLHVELEQTLELQHQKLEKE